jgi:hypothetical protein
MRQQMDVTFDAAFLTKDAGAVVANGADQVAAANKIIDLGGVPNRIDAQADDRRLRNGPNER